MDSAKTVTLSPPWWTCYNKIVQTIGSDNQVSIKPMYTEGNNCFIDIMVMNYQKASALAAIIKPTHVFGNITVHVCVFNCCCERVKGSLIESSDPVIAVIETLKAALETNYYFVKLVNTDEILPPIVKDIIGQVVLVLKRRVIQFFNDDISDFYNNYNEVAATVFNEVLVTEYPNDVKVSLTTVNKRQPKAETEDTTTPKSK
jgi:hypothetical protein